MTVIDTLNNDFYCTYNIRETASGKSQITLYSDWKGKTSGVNKVVVHLSGTDSMSGKPISENKIKVEFSAVNTSGTTDAVDYCGEYLLHYDAYLENGEVIKDFQQPTTVRLEGFAGRPYISYSIYKGPKGWTCVELESNCWRRCNGKLWVQFEDRTQLVPPFLSNTVRFLIPITRRDFTVVSADRTLPVPQRKE